MLNARKKVTLESTEHPILLLSVDILFSIFILYKIVGLVDVKCLYQY